MESPQLNNTLLEVQDWDLLEYQAALDRQEQLVAERQQGQTNDLLILVEHPPVVTLGRRGTEQDLRLPVESFSGSNVTLCRINRGGLATAHEPGQLVVYPIAELKRKDLRWYADSFLNVVVQVLAEYGLEGELKEGEPGVWVNGRKICSFGIAVKKWVTSHGIAFNVNNNLSTFDMIVPCGRPQENVTSVARELGYEINMSDVKQRLIHHFLTAFAYKLKS